VQFIPNRKPVLVLYMMHDGDNKKENDDATRITNIENTDDFDEIKKSMIEVDRIPLHEYQSKDDLHNLLLNLGFTQKSDTEQQLIFENAQLKQYNERLEHHIRLEYYKWRNIYVNEFRTNVMGMTLEEYQEQTKYQRLTCHPSGPIPDLLNDHYDHINMKIAGAYKEDRYQYAVRYLENLATMER
jgi:hypothetical protein